MSAIENYRLINQIADDDLQESDITGLVKDLSNKLSKNGDTLAGNLNCSNTYKLTNVPNPGANGDVANKAYVAASSGTFNGIITSETSPQLSLLRTTAGEDSVRFYNSNVPTSGYRLGSGITTSGDFSLYSETLGANIYSSNSAGRFGLGTSTPDSSTQLFVYNSSFSPYITQLSGQVTNTALGTTGLVLASNASTNMYGVNMNPTLTAFNTSVIPTAAMYNASPIISSTSPGTVTTLAGYYFDGGKFSNMLPQQ